MTPTAGTTFATAGDDGIVITRAVKAPRGLVFAALTQPAHLPHWLGRADWTMTVCHSDPRPGGVRRFVWRRDDGVEMGMNGVYLEVTPPDGLVCTEAYDGGPGDTVNTVRLTERDGTTTITSTIRYPTTQARDAALATEMRAGAAESFARLSEHLQLTVNPAGPTAQGHHR
ncbi:MAG: SRPBCC family protein [Nocardioides sp.]